MPSSGFNENAMGTCILVLWLPVGKATESTAPGRVFQDEGQKSTKLSEHECVCVYMRQGTVLVHLRSKDIIPFPAWQVDGPPVLPPTMREAGERMAFCNRFLSWRNQN